MNCFYYLILLFLCGFADFIKRFIHVLSKALDHIHNCYFEILVLYFSYIAFLRFYCNKVTGFSWLLMFCGFFSLVSRQLG